MNTTPPSLTHQTPSYQSSWNSHSTLVSRPSWQSRLSIRAAYKHYKLSIDPVSRGFVETQPLSPGMDFKEQPRRTKRSKRAAEAIRCFLGSSLEGTYLPSTETGLTPREQRKARKREQKKLDKLVEYQRRQWGDSICRQLEEKQRKQQLDQLQGQSTQTLKTKVKKTLAKTSGMARIMTPSKDKSLRSSPGCVPNIDLCNESLNKDGIQPWTTTISTNETLVAPAPAPEVLDDQSNPIHELPAAPISYDDDMAKKPLEDFMDWRSRPAVRSPSPTFEILQPRRGLSVSNTETTSTNRQMQCDSCNTAIKMMDYFYSCAECDDGDRMYCARCVEDGRTCRHSLEERTRNIKRHATNPQYSERRSHAMDGLTNNSQLSRGHAELSACQPEAVPSSAPVPIPFEPIKTDVICPKLSTMPTSDLRSPISPVTEIDVLKDLDAKRREQEVSFREKEVTLREREAMLRERETMAAYRERETALVQQFHATAIAHQHEKAAGIGAQFVTAQPRVWSSNQSAYQAPSRNMSSASNRSCIILESPAAMNPTTHPEVAFALAGFEASLAGHSVASSPTRSHGNGNGNTRRSNSNGTNKQSDNTNDRVQNGNLMRRGSSKRSNDSKENDEERDGEDGGNSSPKRLKQGDDMLFACPYGKYDPERYSELNGSEVSYRKCKSGLFRSIPRLKQHLKRVHHRPEHYCRRCYQQFESDVLLENHMRQEIACEARECPFPEKLDDNQQRQIHVKRPGRNARQLWYEIFSIIFPDARQPDSPYVDTKPQPGQIERDTIDAFILAINSILNENQFLPGTAWAAQADIRRSLEQIMRDAQQDVLKQTVQSPETAATSPIPSVLVSPVVPLQEEPLSESRPNMNSRRTSSSGSFKRHRRHSSLQVPINPPRPILKVNTKMTSGSAPTTHTPTSSSNSAQEFRLPVNLPTHVSEDRGYGEGSSSWKFGDDQDAMTESVPEPSSAASSASRKSVSFATPPPRIQGDHRAKAKARTLPSVVDSAYGTISPTTSQHPHSFQQNIPSPQFTIPPPGTNLSFVNPQWLQKTSPMTPNSNVAWNWSFGQVQNSDTTMMNVCEHETNAQYMNLNTVPFQQPQHQQQYQDQYSQSFQRQCDSSGNVWPW